MGINLVRSQPRPGSMVLLRNPCPSELVGKGLTILEDRVSVIEAAAVPRCQMNRAGRDGSSGFFGRNGLWLGFLT